MSTLAENAAAVKAAAQAIDAAIVAKGGTTAGGLANAAAAIQAIPSGGGDPLVPEGGWLNDGDTHIWFDNSEWPYGYDGKVEVVLNYSSSPTINFGDGSPDVIADKSNFHTYDFSARGKIRIDIKGGEGVCLGISLSENTSNMFRGRNVVSRYVFSNFVTHAEIGNGVTLYGSAFLRCYNLRGVKLSEKDLSNYCLLGTGLKRIVLPEGVKKIGNRALLYSSAHDIDIPSSIEEIGTYNFNSFSYPTPMTNIVCRSTIPPILGGDNGLAYNAYVFVPYSHDHSILESYKTATNWATYSARMFELTEGGEIPEVGA